MARHTNVDKNHDRFIEIMKSKRTPIVDQCTDNGVCGRIEKGSKFCGAYINPSRRWVLGTCPLATHVVTRIDDKDKGKTRVGQQKQKRRRR